MKMMLMLWMLAVSSAQAGECRWTEDDLERAAATMTMVMVGSDQVPVRGRAARELFAADLRACGMTQAATRFEEWRKARRWTNTWIGAGIGGSVIILGALLAVPAAVTAPRAGDRKVLMLRSMRDGV